MEAHYVKRPEELTEEQIERMWQRIVTEVNQMAYDERDVVSEETHETGLDVNQFIPGHADPEDLSDEGILRAVHEAHAAFAVFQSRVADLGAKVNAAEAEASSKRANAGVARDEYNELKAVVASMSN